MKYLTIEQSQKLIELGLPEKTADLVFPCLRHENGKEYISNFPIDKNSEFYSLFISIKDKSKSIYTWSLDKLIDLMPEKIMLGDSSVEQEEHGLEIYKIDDNVDRYIVCYTLTFSAYDREFSSDSLIGAVFEMMCYLLRRGLIENK